MLLRPVPPLMRVPWIATSLGQPQSCVNRYSYVRVINNSASDKLFADAANEEAEEKDYLKSSRITRLENEHENWDGEERVQHTVLRMLMDKYKPLRTGVIQSADEKLKHTPPKVRSGSQVSVTPKVPSTGSWSTEPLLPSKEGHQPWHTEFKVPSHATSSVKHALFPSLPPQSSRKPTPVDDREKRKLREEKKRAKHVGRLVTAKESTLDYRLGLGKAGRQAGFDGISGPVSLKGLANIVEERIETARQAGLFQAVKGRGKPLPRTVEETNPFIAREEFLMNRIIQRNGAVPPWVEIQNELENSVASFREIIRQSWIRRVVRTITSTNPSELLHRFTLEDIKAIRDQEWQQREHSYHQVAFNELNALVRKYNNLAPYAVRRPLYSLNVELEKLFEESAQEILYQLAERATQKGQVPTKHGSQSSGSAVSSPSASIQDRTSADAWPFRDFFRAWWRTILSSLGSKLPNYKQ